MYILEIEVLHLIQILSFLVKILWKLWKEYDKIITIMYY